MSRLAPSLLAALAGRTPEEELVIQASGGQSFRLQPRQDTVGLSPEAQAVLMGAAPSGDVPVIEDARGNRIDGTTPQAATNDFRPTEEEWLAMGLGERDPVTGQVVARQGVSRNMISSVLGQRFQDRQKLNRTARDYDTIREMVQSGDIDIATATKAAESAEAKSGLSRAQLLEIDSYRWIHAADGEYAQMLELQRAQRAAELKMPVAAIAKDGSGEIDETWRIANQIRQQEAIIQQKPALTLVQSELDRAKSIYDLAIKQAHVEKEARLKAGEHPAVVNHVFKQQTDAAQKTWNDAQMSITGRKAAVQQPATDAATPSATPAAPVAAAQQLSHPSLPVGVSIRADYTSLADAKTQLKAGEYGLYNGHLVRKTGWGNLEEVK